MDVKLWACSITGDQCWGSCSGTYSILGKTPSMLIPPPVCSPLQLFLPVPHSRMLQGGSADSKDDGGPQFAEVFVIIWFGAVVITLNSKLLGGTM